MSMLVVGPARSCDNYWQESLVVRLCVFRRRLEIYDYWVITILCNQEVRRQPGALNVIGYWIYNTKGSSMVFRC